MWYTMRNGANLRGWEPDDSWHEAAAETLTGWKSWNKLAPLLVETAMAHRKVETKEMSVTEMELKTLLLRKKKTGRYLERSDLKLALSRNLEKEKSTEREKHLDKIKESAEMGRAPKKTQSKHFNWKSIAKDGNPESVLTKYFRDLYSLRRTGGVNPIRETTLGGAVEKHENRLCWWNVDLAKETGKCLEEAEKRERVTRSNHSRCIESIASRMFGKAGEVVVVDVLEHGFPGRLAVFVDGDGSESGGCNVLDQVQAYCWTVCDAKSLGLRLAQVTPSTEIRKCTDCVCAEDTR